MRIFDVIQNAAFALRESSDSPRLDAEILLAHVLCVSRTQILVESKQDLDPEQVSRFDALVQRRLGKEPVAYLIGMREFFGLDILVSKDVLIPRPDTETIVDKALEFVPKLKPSTVIDVCTGSGCIALAIAKERAMADVFACDFSDAALDVAQKNIEAHDLSERVSLRRGDLLAPFALMRDVDLIVSNPPYIRASDMEALMDDVKLYEPHLALVGTGDNGLALHARILEQAREILRAGGRLILEFGFDQHDEAAALSHDGFSAPILFKDYGDNWRGAIWQKL